MTTMKKTPLLLWLTLAAPLLGHAAGLLAVDNPAKNGQGNQVYATAEAFAGNDQVAMRQYGSDWQGSYSPRSGTNLGLLSARAEAGVQWQGYRLGALYRAEALVEANRDTSDLAQQYNTRRGYDMGRNYLLDYKIKGFEASGARLSKSFQLDLGRQWQLDWGLGASYLRGTRIKLATATGQVSTINTKDFDARVSMNDTDSQIDVTDPISFNAPYGRLAMPSGQGYALDAGVVFHHLPSGASIELAVADLAGRMDWKDVPNNATNFSTATKRYDTNGFVQFDPSTSRTSSYQNLSQPLDPKLWLAANYPLGDFELQGATSYTQGYWFPQAGVKYHLNPQWTVNADVDLRFNTFGLAVQHQWFYLALRMDTLNLDAAKAYGLSGGVHIPF